MRPLETPEAMAERIVEEMIDGGFVAGIRGIREDRRAIAAALEEAATLKDAGDLCERLDGLDAVDCYAAGLRAAAALVKGSKVRKRSARKLGGAS